MRGFREFEEDNDLSDENFIAYKRHFAEALLLYPNDVFKAALSVFPADVGLAVKVAHTWQFDKDVLAHKAELIETRGDDAFLPSKSQFLSALWERMGQEEDTLSYAKVADIYAKSRGFYPEKTTTINNNNNVQPSLIVNKVMRVTVADSDEDWRAKAIEQQAKLIGDAG